MEQNIRLQQNKAYEFLMRLTRRLSSQQLMIVLAILVGLVAGFAAYVFQKLLHLIESCLVSWLPVDSVGYLFLVYPAVGIILASLFVRFIVKDNISEGVARVLYAISKTGSRIKPHNCYSSVVGGAVTIGFGGSVGPEAPIVLTGSAIGSNIAQIFKLNYRDTTLLLGCGAAGAVAAIFKAPVTGLIFVLEVLMLDISMRAIVPLLISSVASTTLVLFLKGFDPMLNVEVGVNFNLQYLHMYVVLAVLCGAVSFYFLNVNGKVQAMFSRFRSQSMRWLIGGISLGLLIFLFPPLYGEGYSSFIDMMHGRIEPLFDNSLFYQYRNIPWVVVLFLLGTLFLKVVAMAITNATGKRTDVTADRPAWLIGSGGAGDYIYDLESYISTNQYSWNGYANCQGIHNFVKDHADEGFEMRHFQAAWVCEIYGYRNWDYDGSVNGRDYTWQKLLKAPAGTSGWFLPSIGQLAYMRTNINYLDERLEAVKDYSSGWPDYNARIVPLSYSYLPYWSSTIVSGDNYSALYQYITPTKPNEAIKGYRNNSNLPRPILVF